jgi:voltage-gated potassium channel Kch
MFGVALVMAIALPLKTAMFFAWLSALKLRSRTAFLSALSLANYSEFGLIVCSISVASGLLAKEWLVIMALAVSISFVFSALINARAHGLYARWSNVINRFQRSERLPEDAFLEPGEASVLIAGMGRVGSGAFDAFNDHLNQHACGVDVDIKRVNEQRALGRNVVLGDAEDLDFWSTINLESIRLIVFAMPNHLDTLEAVKLLRKVGYKGRTAAIAKYEDQKIVLLKAGIDEVFNYFAEVGIGLAEQSLHLIEPNH